MDNQAHLYRLSQPLLDVHHKGMSARDAARELGSQLFNPRTTGFDVMIMMLDDLASASLSGQSQSEGADLSVDPLLAELVQRLFGRWQSLALIPDAREIFRLAGSFVDARSRMIDAYRSNRHVLTLKTLNINAMQCLDASDGLYQRAVYLSRACSNISNMASPQIFQLFFPEEARQTQLSASLQVREPLLTGYSDAELGARLMRRLRNHRLATFDPTYPVDGVRSVYVLIPLMISYLTHPSQTMETKMERELADLKASLAELAMQMESVNQRYARLTVQALAS